MRILLVTPPLTQLNTPYPATPYLAGYLSKQGVEVYQQDLGIELIDRIFTAAMLAEVFDSVDDAGATSHADAKMLALRHRYIATIDSVIRFLRGGDATLANRIGTRGFLPEGERFRHLADLEFLFGDLGVLDRAKHLATLYIEDISDFIRRNVSPHFELIRYAESLCVALPTFDSLKAAVDGEPSLIDRLIIDTFSAYFDEVKPDVVGFTVPFPGNLYAALICASWLKQNRPNVKVLMGGGYVSTELRDLSDPRLFGYIDYLLYDDGEISILRLLEHMQGKRSEDTLVRTSFLKDGKLTNVGNAHLDVAGSERPAPLYSQLPIGKYLDMLETPNPMLKLWSDGRWNKLILAHGCYWAKCAFCDVTLDYIKRFEPYDASAIVDMMEDVMAQTGQSGFHFVDEAAPPALLKKISLEIIRRGLTVSWWANVRFERSFTRELCLLMARAGCIAVSGGLEVASDRLLALMSKGVDIKQTAKVTSALSSAGILVHAYLMYGFPSETTQETIDSLEVVRQLFEQKLIQSAFWHRFAMTVHSPAGCNPERYGAKPLSSKKNPFANNEIFFTDSTDTDLEMLGEGLRKATYNYMHNLGLEKSVATWFDDRVPQAKVAPTLIAGCLVTVKNDSFPDSGTLVWLADGYQLLLTDSRRPKLHIFTQSKMVEVIFRLEEIAFWENFFLLLDEHSNFVAVDLVISLAKNHLPGGVAVISSSKVWKTARKNGLVVV
ncbi:radical SAM protein [uncultured Acetobacteroides sp.]|uniref:B12-binding domain-containing radical SAM protein n=1 Tax=uncultured Acetobacteroides sp. TaxID=1760811 RepID=UPI0029F56838|nr:radical SAM protein [uncultured Acetobacteroides sp.]